MAAWHRLVKGRVHEAGVVKRDQQAQAPKRVGRRRRGNGRAGGAEIGGVKDGAREDRGRKESGRSATATQRDACREPTGCYRRRGETRDRPSLRHPRNSLPQGGTV